VHPSMGMAGAFFFCDDDEYCFFRIASCDRWAVHRVADDTCVGQLVAPRPSAPWEPAPSFRGESLARRVLATAASMMNPRRSR
jgi:hypothetical protein